MELDQADDPGVPKVRAPLCRHLRCKGMFVSGGRPDEPDMLPYDATIWWCSRTQKQVGPDDQPCHDSECVQGRGCFEPTDPA